MSVFSATVISEAGIWRARRAMFTRSTQAPGEPAAYRQDMPIALAYVLGVAPIIAISGSLVHLARA